MEVGTSVYYRSSECKTEKQIVALEIMLLYICIVALLVMEVNKLSASLLLITGRANRKLSGSLGTRLI